MKNPNTGNKNYIALYRGEHITAHFVPIKEDFNPEIVLGYIQGITMEDVLEKYRLILEYRYFLSDIEIEEVLESTTFLEIDLPKPKQDTKEEEIKLPF